jgi:hypothetical protein
MQKDFFLHLLVSIFSSSDQTCTLRFCSASFHFASIRISVFPNDTDCDIQSWKRVKLNEKDISVRIDAEEHNSELVNYSGPTVRGIVGLDTAQK